MDPVTPLYVSIAASIASILLILVVFELIRSRRLRERYALLWLATGVVLLVLSAWRGGLNTIAGWVGVTGYPPAVLFAADYPHDYPEVEAAVMVVRHRLRILEVPAQMRGRETGRSSITMLRSLYYAIKVTLALLVGIFRRRIVPLEES